MSVNLDNTRAALRCWSEGDLDGALANMDPNIEWHLAFPLPDLPPGTRVFHGHGEVKETWVRLRDVFDTLTIEIEDVLHDADDRLVCRALFDGLGEASGVSVKRTLYYVMDFDSGRLTRIRPFEDLAEAQRAAGLDESRSEEHTSE